MVGQVVTVEEVAPIVGRDRLTRMLEAYCRARGLLFARRQAEGVDDALNASRLGVAAAVAIAEGHATREETEARIRAAMPTTPAEREALLRWVEHARGPDAPDLDVVLETLAREAEMDPPPWPAHVG